jgi:hypothetical protein
MRASVYAARNCSQAAPTGASLLPLLRRAIAQGRLHGEVYTGR